MKIKPFLFLLSFLIVASANSFAAARRLPQQISENIYDFTLRHDGRDRIYRVFIPTGYKQEQAVPLVIFFHGGGGTAKGAMWDSAWPEKAEQENFIAVYPEGTAPDPTRPGKFRGNPQTWNDGSGRDFTAVNQKVDDVGFVRQMIAALSERFHIDSNRIYASGFSNGASMTFRVGRELPEIFAAIAPVAGGDWLDTQAFKAPVSMIYITGTEDPQNPLEGGKIGLGRKSFGVKKPVAEMIRDWQQGLGCPPESQLLLNENGVKGIAYGLCQNNTEIWFYTVEGLGHHWPGDRYVLPAILVGPKTNKLYATDLIWEFFQAHPKHS